MGLMQSGSNFTDRIVKYVAKRAERKTKPASPPMGHVIPWCEVFKVFSGVLIPKHGIRPGAHYIRVFLLYVFIEQC